MTWIAVKVRPADAERETVMQALFGLGSQGVHEEGDALLTHFSPETDVGEIRRVLAATGMSEPPEIYAAADVNWAERWKDQVRAHTVGSLTIAPPWLADAFDQQNSIVIDPGMAFGTGEHASTRCVMLLMQGILQTGDRVADLGAGSGVLSIAAVRLGARSVAAIEIDADALGNLEENLTRNNATDPVVVLLGDAEQLLPLVAPIDVVIANILSSVALVLLPAIDAAVVETGSAILGGIMTSEQATVSESLRQRGWLVFDSTNEDGWCAIAIRRA